MGLAELLFSNICYYFYLLAKTLNIYPIKAIFFINLGLKVLNHRCKTIING